MPTYIRDGGAWKTVSGGSIPAATVPTGAVFHFAASTPPTGYLKANGDTVPNGTGTVQGISANFSDLYAILGSTYGAAGKLPDLRGEFVRGWADDRAVDTGRTFGTEQGDAFQGHKHQTSRTVLMTAGVDASFDFLSNIADSRDAQGYNFADQMQVAPVTDGTNGTPRTAAETRPRNIALLACIKY
jgi:phage-related tail fiber protein